MESKGNIVSDEKKNRSRGENWAPEEKDTFLEIMKESAPIVENKLTDTNTNKRKNQEWVIIQNKLQELTGKHRDIIQLKGFWRRAKMSAKKSVSQHRRATQATGGGQKPPSPPPNDMKILEMCPIDFVIEENIYDSDAVTQLTEMDAPLKSDVHNSTTTIYDIDEDLHNEEDPFVDNIVTVTDVNSNEVNDVTYEVVRKHRPGEHKESTPKRKITGKAAIVQSNIELKEKASSYMEEEFELKIKYHKQEAAHQQLRQKLEIDILLIEKEIKLLELEIVKKKLINS